MLSGMSRYESGYIEIKYDKINIEQNQANYRSHIPHQQAIKSEKLLSFVVSFQQIHPLKLNTHTRLGDLKQRQRNQFTEKNLAQKREN